jgi:hypothetical protein
MLYLPGGEVASRFFLVDRGFRCVPRWFLAREIRRKARIVWLDRPARAAYHCRTAKLFIRFAGL